MSYSEDLKAFAASHKYEDVMVDGAKFHYVLNGRKDLFGRLPGTAFRLPTGASDQPGTGNGHACLFQENWRKKTNLCRSQ